MSGEQPRMRSAANRRWRAARRGGAFSLVETLIVLLVVGIVLKIALPSTGGLQQQNALQTAENSVQLVADLAQSSFGHTGTYATNAGDLATVFGSQESTVSVVGYDKAASSMPTQVAIATGCFRTSNSGSDPAKCVTNGGASWMAIVADAYDPTNPRSSVCVYENLVSTGPPAKWHGKDASWPAALPSGQSPTALRSTYSCPPSDNFPAMVAAATTPAPTTTTTPSQGTSSGPGSGGTLQITVPGSGVGQPTDVVVGGHTDVKPSVAGGSGPYQWSASGLPPGLSINPSTGEITGSASGNNGPYPKTVAVTISVSDSSGASGTYVLPVKIQQVVTVSASGCSGNGTEPVGEVGIPYSGTVEACGGTGSGYTFSVPAGQLPPGLSLDPATGAITGVPTTAGSYPFTVTAYDTSGASSTTRETIAVNDGPYVCGTQNGAGTLPDAEVGAPYSAGLTGCSGSGSGYTYKVSSGALPPGLTLGSSSGALTGTPTSTGPSTFTVSVTDSAGKTGPATTYTVTVNAAPSICNTKLPAAEDGIAYSGSVGACSGTGSGYTFSVSSGTLPSGLTLDATTGALSGTPNGATSQTFTVEVTDSAGGTGTKAVTIPVDAAPSICSTTLPAAEQDTVYSGSISACGGDGNYTYAASGLPSGLYIDSSTGAVSGVASGTAATSSVVFTVTDGAGGTATKTVTLTVDPNPTQGNGAPCGSSNVPSAEDNNPYSAQLAGCGNGNGPYSFALAGGNLPTGLALSSSGVISGTPQTSAPSGGKAWPFTIETTDTKGGVETQNLSIYVYPRLTGCATAMPDGDVGETPAYAGSAQVCGGDSAAGYTYSVSTGSLPPGLTLDATTGAVSGVPSAAGTYSFTILASDTVGTLDQNFTVQIYSALSVCSMSPSPATTDTGHAYSAQVSACGGSTPVTFTLLSGPPGAAIAASSGMLSGVSATAGTYNVNVKVCDPYTCASGIAGQVVVNQLTATLSVPGSWEVDQAGYTVSISYNGTAPFSVTGSGFPSGVSAASGSYTPYTTGNYSPSVTVCDKYTCTTASASTYVYPQPAPPPPPPTYTPPPSSGYSPPPTSPPTTSPPPASSGPTMVNNYNTAKNLMNQGQTLYYYNSSGQLTQYTMGANNGVPRGTPLYVVSPSGPWSTYY